MGKKSKNANKAARKRETTQDLLPLEAVFQRHLARLRHRRAGTAAIPSGCRHVGTPIRDAQRREVLEFLALRYQTHGNRSDPRFSENVVEMQALTIKWAGQYNCPCVDPSCTKGMPEVLLASTAEYLLKYEYNEIRNQLLDLLFVYGSVQKLIESLREGVIQIEDLRKPNISVLQDLMTQGIQSMYAIGETEYSITRFLANKLPCDCLKDTKRELKQRPKPSFCCNKRCRKEMEVGAFFRCSGCNVARYCSAACQQQDWDQDHKRLCKSISCNNAAATTTT